MWPGPYSQSTATTGTNYPLPPAPPEPDRSQDVNRHLGMWCGCMLLDCCHHELPEDGYVFIHQGSGRHADSGSPQSGYLLPWEPGDESWRMDDGLPVARVA